MALLITDTFDYKGLTLNQIYVRLEYKVDMSSQSIKINARPFVDKETFKNQGYYSHLNIQEFSPYMTFVVPYDRNTDGDIVINVVHRKTKDMLSTAITEDRLLFYDDYPRDPSTGEIIVDPSTGLPEYEPGDPIIDPSTGEQAFETITIRPKFTDASNIQEVDT